MAVAGILHTGLTVSDLDRSIVFYRDLLGLELIARWDSSQPYLRIVVGYPDADLRIALLRLPSGPDGASGHHIELLEYRRPRGVRGDAYAELKAKGVRFKSAPVDITHGRDSGGKAVYFLDPDDITLEMIQPAPRT
ncbi:MAG TPA: VOC family protein [Methylomirabilota bacterium]|jgi:catechol 2,3-dioxygenase-like lactoylglutathione lyase family enzyme